MIEEIVRDAKQNFTTEEGLITLRHKDHRTGVDENDVLYTAYFYEILKQLDFGFNPEPLKESLLHLLVVPGLYNAHWRNTDEPLSKDNLVAIDHLRLLLTNFEDRFDIMWYGKEHKWVYNNTGDKSWKRTLRQYRTPDIQAYIEYLAMDKPFWLKDKYMKMAFYFTINNKKKDSKERYETDNRLLLWLKLQGLMSIDKQFRVYNTNLLADSGRKFNSSTPLQTMFEIFFPMNITGTKHPIVSLAQILAI